MKFKKKKKRITLRQINANLQDQVRMNGAVTDELLACLDQWLPVVMKRNIRQRIENMRLSLRGHDPNRTVNE